MPRRLILLLVALVCLAAVVAGCSSNDSQQQEANTTSGSEETTSSSQAEDKEKAGSAAGSAAGSQKESANPPSGGRPEFVDVPADDLAALAEAREPEGYLPADAPAYPGEPYETVHAIYPVDPANPFQVCGAATNSFAGGVAQNLGTVYLQPPTEEDGTDHPPIPFTKYLVTSIKTANPTWIIKGSFDPASVVYEDATYIQTVVTVQGGRMPDGTIQLIAGDQLLGVGRGYVFTTIYDSANNWYIPVVQPQAVLGPWDNASVQSRDRLIYTQDYYCDYPQYPEEPVEAPEPPEDNTEEIPPPPTIE